MNDSQTLFDQIKALISPEFWPYIDALLAIFEKVRQRELTQDAAAIALQEAGALPIVSALAGKRVDDGSRFIDFGDGNTMGNITIGDVAGGHVIKQLQIAMPIIINQQVHYHLPNDPSENNAMPQPVTPLIEDNGWEELRTDPLYEPYQIPKHAITWRQQVLERPGCYVVWADPAQGKTALIRHLWQVLEADGWIVIGYIFREGHRSNVAEAIRYIRRQLRSIELIDAGSVESLAIPWPKIDNAVQDGKRIAILIDALDESNPDNEQRRLLDQLLPRFLVTQTRVVVTSRDQMNAYPVVLNGFLPREATLRLANFAIDDIRGLADQRNIKNRKKLFERIFADTTGQPALVAEILRSVNPTAALQHLPNSLHVQQRSATLELQVMEQVVGDDQLGLLHRILTLLAVAPASLTFEELRTILNDPGDPLLIRRVCTSLARHLKDGQLYRLRNPSVRVHILQDAEQGGYFAANATTMRASIASWYQTQYYQATGLTLRLPGHVLLYAPSFLLDAAEPATFAGERIFADKRWRDALDSDFDSLVDQRAAVLAAWKAAEHHGSECARILGVTTCALVFTSLVPAFPPAAVADLVRRDMITKDQAQRYAQVYGSQPERSELLGWLPKMAPVSRNHPFVEVFDRIAQYDKKDYGRELNRLQRRYARAGTHKLDLLRDVLRTEYNALLTSAASDNQVYHSAFGAAEETRTLPELITALKYALIDPRQPAEFGLGLPLGAADDLSDLLSDIAWAWESEGAEQEYIAETYCEITRLIAGGSRAFYFGALSILAPAIGRVFGKEYLERIAAIVEAITQAYP